MRNSPQNYKASPAIWDHSEHTPRNSSQAGWHSICQHCTYERLHWYWCSWRSYEVRLL